MKYNSNRYFTILIRTYYLNVCKNISNEFLHDDDHKDMRVRRRRAKRSAAENEPKE